MIGKLKLFWLLSCFASLSLADAYDRKDFSFLYNKIFVNVINKQYPAFHMTLSRFILPLHFLSASFLL